MNFLSDLETQAYILMEAAVIEALSKTGSIELHPRLLNSLLIYDTKGSQELTRLLDECISVGDGAGVPILICTPTWRANRERVTEAGLNTDVNADAVTFLKTVRSRWDNPHVPIYVGGLMGCKNDSYKPEEALPAEQARIFHSWQADKLSTEADFLMGATLPSLSEAEGMAYAMARTGTPYIISFVINRHGRILDGTSLETAFDCIDKQVSPKPAGYMVNCAYPSFLCPDSQPNRIYSRLIGFQANASSLDHADLDNSKEVYADDITDWGDRMIELNRKFGVKILGGCCGTTSEHLAYIVDHI